MLKHELSVPLIDKVTKNKATRLPGWSVACFETRTKTLFYISRQNSAALIARDFSFVNKSAKFGCVLDTGLTKMEATLKHEWLYGKTKKAGYTERMEESVLREFTSLKRELDLFILDPQKDSLDELDDDAIFEYWDAVLHRLSDLEEEGMEQFSINEVKEGEEKLKHKYRFRPYESKKGGVYFIADKVNGYIKIGCSANVVRRCKDLQVGYPEELSIVRFIESNDPFALEGKLQKRFSVFHLRGDWFKMTEEDIGSFLDE